jgi:class 3 adenylate cyclase
MRLTIGRKIFAVAGFLLALMAAAAVLSTWKVRQASNEIHAVARYFVPLADRIAEIQAGVLQQEVIVQRIVRDFALQDADRQAIEEHIAAFEAGGRLIDEAIDQAILLTKAAIEESPGRQADVEMSRMGAMLQALERSHESLRDIVLRAIDAYRDGQPPAVDALIGAFEQAQARFDDTIAGAVSEVLAFSEASAQRVDDHEHVVVRFNALTTAIALVLGLLFAALLTRSVVRPVRALRDGTRAIEAGDLTRDLPVTTTDEIADLTRTFNHMLSGLRAKDRLKAVFGQYVDPRVVETLLANHAVDTSGLHLPQKKVVTVFFSDIEDFTRIGEQLSATGLISLMNEYFTLASEPIVEKRGVIDKYIGDAIMAFWCPPFVEAGDEAAAACLAALAQFDQLAVLRARMPDVTGLRKGLPEVNIRIGLASGEAVVGSVGSQHAKNYTVLGDTVNLGSRLEGANKIYGTRILICEETRRRAGDAVETREIDSIIVAGKSEPVRIFELLAASGGLSDAQAAARDAFDHGLAAYRASDWPEAEAGFVACLEHCPEDSPARIFRRRLELMRETGAPEPWDGVWRLDRK